MLYWIFSTCPIEKIITTMQTTNDIYPAVEKLIIQLKEYPASNLSVILDHRMHKVAWTTGGELIEELYRVLTSSLINESSLFSLEVRIKIERLLNLIKNQIHMHEQIEVRHRMYIK